MASLNRSILRLAVPALGALIAEPLFLLADTAMIGHLGVEPLAGLGLAAAVLQTIIGLMVFLAYATTPAVARRIGAGDERGAVSVGVDGLWLALGLGIVLGAAGALLSPTLVGLFHAAPGVAAQATTYLSISMAGIPAMLLVFAATGLLRGLQDTMTPLWVAGAGFAANIALNYAFIYLAGWGIAGSAAGTVIAQWAMVGAYLLVVARHVRRTGADPRPHRAGIGGSARAGGWLLLRTAALRAAMLLAIFVATGLGTRELAGFQLVMTIFSTVAFALDALAIAAQALVGKGLGSSDPLGVRAVLRRCVLWGIGSGAVFGLLVAALSGPIGPLLTSDPALSRMLVPSLLILALGAPLAGFVFVLDGVLIGAGDARYLALTGLLNLACFIPLALAVLARGTAGAEGLAWLTAAFALGYIGARALTLGLRARGTAWMRTGV
ncbi:MATE family efflux transporter [Mycetocola spongiae]|uniref:MATE family efflux transporter n=1 Tax=Mycetocola spongiae TaxID=2859226 RepID=UPI001CF31E0C|nr:MATE family efflux transporter [Mycetocola spongiae]UCR88207.1 MATE family efflux transporter [Mycetocola spongiae]